MKKALFTFITLALSVTMQAQVKRTNAMDSMREKFEREREAIAETFNENVKKAHDEYEQYEKKMRAEYEKYVSSIKKTWGKNNVIDDTQSEWVEYGNDYKSRSIVDFENGDITVEVVLDDDVNENDSEEIEKRLAEAIEKMLESKGSTDPYSNKKGSGLTRKPILDGLVDLSKYNIGKSEKEEAISNVKNNSKTPPAPTVRGKELPQPTVKGENKGNSLIGQSEKNARIKERQREVENKLENNAKKIADLKDKQEKAKQLAEEKNKKEEQEKAKQLAEEKNKKEEQEKAKQLAEEKNKKEEQEKAKQLAEEKKKKEEQEKAKQLAEEKNKKEEKTSSSDIAKAIAEQSEKKITTIQGEDNKERKVVKVNMVLVSDNLSKSAALYKDYVAEYSNSFSIEEPLIFAVIEQESSFNPEAKSWVPAYGLMQLVPKSGGFDAYRYVYKREWVPTMSYLYVPNQNIELGTAYLRILMNQFKNVTDPDCRRLCVIASYNTGAGNVCRAFTGKTNVKAAVELINKMSYDELFRHLTNKLSTEEARKYVSGVSKRREKYIK